MHLEREERAIGDEQEDWRPERAWSMQPKGIYQ